MILAAYAIKSADKKGYRQPRDRCRLLDLNGINKSPNSRTINWRIKRLDGDGIKLMVYKSIDDEYGIIDATVDSTSAKSRKDGEYRAKMYKKLNEWKQTHMVIGRKAHKI